MSSESTRSEHPTLSKVALAIGEKEEYSRGEYGFQTQS